MTIGHEFTEHDPTQFAREILSRSQDALQRSVAVISPEVPHADPLSVLPETTETRDDGRAQAYINGALEPLTAEQSIQLRGIAAELGFARPIDLTLSEQGILGAHVILEGGMPHKILAEAMMVLEDEAASPTTLIFSASPSVKLNDAGKASAERILGYVPENEYEVAQALVANLPGFRALKQPEVSVGGYDLDEIYTVTNETSGQFMRVGYVGKVPVILMAIDRVNYVDEATGKPKYRQPGAAEVIKIVSDVASAQGDNLLPLAFVTSATYQPSRNVAGAQAALTTGRQVGIATYGTERLNAITGEAAQPKRDDQLPGELYKMAKDIAALDKLLVPSTAE
jgi:hypothetical protein